MQFRWERFRSLADTGWIDLRPLTIVIGANNTGKTSFYQPLLLLNQTGLSSHTSPALVTRGELIDVGHFEDIAMNRDVANTIKLSFRNLETRRLLRGTFKSRALSPDSLGLEFDRDSLGSVLLKQYDVRNSSGEQLLLRKRLKDGSYSLRTAPPNPWPRDKDRGGRQAELLARIHAEIESERPDRFLFTGRTATTNLLPEIETPPKRGAGLRELNWMLRYLVLAGAVFTGIWNEIKDLSYLGPLRSLPERWYELSGQPPQSVGRGGKFAAEILYRNRDQDLAGEVSNWLREFDFPSRVQFKQVESDSFSVSLRRGRGPAINLADCGVGVSQLLPLIVQGLHTPEGGIVIAEQPEIHLNPRLQAKLAELFAAFVEPGRKRVIVETHSEHLLLRIRTLIARGDLDHDQVGLFFTSKERGTSTIEQIPISADGDIAVRDWPSGFFEESLTEALALANAQAAT